MVALLRRLTYTPVTETNHKAGSADEVKRRLRARQRARHCAIQALYQAQVNPLPPVELVAQFRADNELEEADAEFFTEGVLAVLRRAPEFDADIAPFAYRPPEEMDPVERAILRLAAWELKERLDVLSGSSLIRPRRSRAFRRQQVTAVNGTRRGAPTARCRDTARVDDSASGEFARIDLILAQQDLTDSTGVALGPGDDAALLTPLRAWRSLTVDTLVGGFTFLGTEPGARDAPRACRQPFRSRCNGCGSGSVSARRDPPGPRC